MDPTTRLVHRLMAHRASQPGRRTYESIDACVDGEVVAVLVVERNPEDGSCCLLFAADSEGTLSEHPVFGKAFLAGGSGSFKIGNGFAFDFGMVGKTRAVAVLPLLAGRNLPAWPENAFVRLTKEVVLDFQINDPAKPRTLYLDRHPDWPALPAETAWRVLGSRVPFDLPTLAPARVLQAHPQTRMGGITTATVVSKIIVEFDDGRCIWAVDPEAHAMPTSDPEIVGVVSTFLSRPVESVAMVDRQSAHRAILRVGRRNGTTRRAGNEALRPGGENDQAQP